MKSMTRSIVDSEISVNIAETKKNLLTRINKEFYSCLLQKPISGCLIIDRLLKYIPPAYLRFAFAVKKAVLRYCRKEV